MPYDASLRSARRRSPPEGSWAKIVLLTPLAGLCGEPLGCVTNAAPLQALLPAARPSYPLWGGAPAAAGEGIYLSKTLYRV